MTLFYDAIKIAFKLVSCNPHKGVALNGYLDIINGLTAHHYMIFNINKYKKQLKN